MYRMCFSAAPSLKSRCDSDLRGSFWVSALPQAINMGGKIDEIIQALGSVQSLLRVVLHSERRKHAITQNLVEITATLAVYCRFGFTAVLSSTGFAAAS
eukprot:291420-Amphidinium_carterae.3